MLGQLVINLGRKKIEIKSLPLQFTKKKNLGRLCVYICTIEIVKVVEENVKANFYNLEIALPKNDTRHKEYIDRFNHVSSPFLAS